MRRLSAVIFCLVSLTGGCAFKQGSVRTSTPSPVTGGLVEANRHGNEGVISLVVTMTVKPENEQEFLDICGSYAAYVHTHSPGVLLYTLNKDPRIEHTYVWIERYVDDAAIRHKADTPEFKSAVAKVMPLLARPPEARRLVQVIPR
jgi:quinol monooxygenase YgiN